MQRMKKMAFGAVESIRTYMQLLLYMQHSLKFGTVFDERGSFSKFYLCLVAITSVDLPLKFWFVLGNERGPLPFSKIL